MKRRTAVRIFPKMLAIASIFLTACGHGDQSALDSAGIQSGRLNSLWWLFFFITATVYVIVMLLLVAAYLRVPRAASKSEPDIDPNRARDRRVSNVIKGAVAVTVLTVFALMITSFRAGRAVDTLSQAQNPLEIKVTGQQWWWQVEYQDPTPSNMVTTANEIHIPIGRPIKIDLESHDVIHSFWVPNLHGKKDLIPNYPTTIYFQADTPGIYWGQCAEFCGYEHAKMRLMVIAESPEDFNAWYTASQARAPSPQTDSQKLGQQIFLRSVCTQCHTINGTDASGRVGPNLTHVASKPYIGAASLVNNRENLMSWITDPQAIKPGIRMPMNTFSESDLNALVDYIQSLK
jgi:cytochrome c oxidase subunit 2